MFLTLPMNKKIKSQKCFFLAKMEGGAKSSFIESNFSYRNQPN